MPRLGLGLRLSKYRYSGNALAPLIKCGLIQYATPVTDKVGKSSRSSVRGKALVGDGSTYAKATWTQTSALWDVEFEVSEIPSSVEYILDTRNVSGVGYVYFEAIGTLTTSSGTVQSVGNEYKITDITLEFSNLSFMTYLNLSSGKLTKNLLSLKLTNKSTGITYTLAIESRQSDGIIPLNGSDGSVILCEQFLSPATPVVNSLQESYFDALGGSVAKALGKNLFNKDASTDGFRLDEGNGNAISQAISTVSDFVYVSELINFISSGMDLSQLRICLYDESKTFIEGFRSIEQTSVLNAVYFRVSVLTADKNVLMVNEGLVLLPYEPWQGYYLDSLLTNPYEDGTPIITNHAYISDGQGGSVNASAQYNGRVKYDNRVVDGVVSLKDNFVNEIGLTSKTVTHSTLQMTCDNSTPWASYRTQSIASNGVYTLDAKVSMLLGSYRGYVVVRDLADNVLIAPAFSTSAKETFTVVDGGFKLQFVLCGATAEANEKIYSTKVYKGSTEPQSGQWVSGNSITLSQPYDGITENDNNRILTEADGTPKVLAYDDMLNITNNQMFATEDKQAIGFFKTALTGECLTKTMTFFKQGEQLRDQNGDLLFDAQGNALFTLKPWVTN